MVRLKVKEWELKMKMASVKRATMELEMSFLKMEKMEMVM